MGMYSNLKAIFREFFNATQVLLFFNQMKLKSSKRHQE